MTKKIKTSSGWRFASVVPEANGRLKDRVRINGQRIDGAGRAVRPGDVVTVALDGCVRVLKVAGFVDRRGSAETARGLYEELEMSGRRSAPPG